MVSVDQYVAAIYDNKLYPGIVRAVVDSTATVDFMNRSGIYFIWPSKPYTDDLPVSELLCTVKGQPVAVSKTRFQLADASRIDYLCAAELSDI